MLKVGGSLEEAPTLAWIIKMDFDFLEILGVVDGFVAAWKERGHSWAQLFKSEELRSRLSYVNVVEIRTAFYLKGWPSLGDASEEYPCQESGNTCALFWTTREDNVDASLIRLQHFAAIKCVPKVDNMGPSSRWQWR